MMLFFFFKQKTAYEMRISDWSSDVCSAQVGGQGMEDSQRSTLRNEDAAAPGAVSDLPGLAAKFQRSGADGCGCGCTWIWNRFPRKAGVWNCLRAGRHSTARVGGGLRRRECDSRGIDRWRMTRHS